MKKILAFSLLLNIMFFQGAAFAEERIPLLTKPAPLQHMAFSNPLPRCPDGYIIDERSRTCIRRP
jgi:hypothetical protein